MDTVMKFGEKELDAAHRLSHLGSEDIADLMRETRIREFLAEEPGATQYALTCSTGNNHCMRRTLARMIGEGTVRVWRDAAQGRPLRHQLVSLDCD